MLLRDFFRNEINEAYLFFLSSIFKELNKVILITEINNICINDVLVAMKTLKENLVSRKHDKFVGMMTSTILRSINCEIKEDFFRQVDLFYESLITYIDKWWGPQELRMSQFTVFNLQNLQETSWDQFLAGVEMLKLEDIDPDELYSDFAKLRGLFNTIENDGHLVDKWVKVLKKETFSIPKIIQH